MPEQSNYGGSFRKSDMQNQTRVNRFLARFSNVIAPSGAARHNRVSIMLGTADSIEDDISYLSNTEYTTHASADLANIFYPYEMGFEYDSGDMPSLYPTSAVSGYSKAIDLLPMAWDNPTKVDIIDRYIYPSGDTFLGTLTSTSYDGDTYQYHWDYRVRGIGLRGPLMLTGWGYETKSHAPVPGGGSEPNFFLGDVEHGYLVDPKDYVTAPIDLSYDEDREVWTSHRPAVRYAKVSGLRDHGGNEWNGFTTDGYIGHVQAYDVDVNGNGSIDGPPLRLIASREEPSGTVGFENIQLGDVVGYFPDSGETHRDGYLGHALGPSGANLSANLRTQIFAVNLTEDGGGDGSNTAVADYTYTAKSLDNSITYGTALTPDKARPIGLRSSGDGDVGLGYFDLDNIFNLYDGNEAPTAEECT